MESCFQQASVFSVSSLASGTWSWKKTLAFRLFNYQLFSSSTFQLFIFSILPFWAAFNFQVWRIHPNNGNDFLRSNPEIEELKNRKKLKNWKAEVLKDGDIENRMVLNYVCLRSSFSSLQFSFFISSFLCLLGFRCSLGCSNVNTENTGSSLRPKEPPTPLKSEWPGADLICLCWACGRPRAESRWRLF